MDAPLRLTDPVPEPRRRGRRSAAGRQFRRDVLADLERFHPVYGGMPEHDEEVAEEIGARLTVLAVRTHVPWQGKRRPPVTLRMRHALRQLARWGGEMGVGQLAEKVGTGVPAASQLSSRMERRGLVSKERGGRDGRRRTVRLTRWGWRCVPRDERPRREEEWLPRGSTGEMWGEGRRRRAWPKPLRRVEQARSPLEEGLRGSAVSGREVLAGLRAVQSRLHGYDVERWELGFDAAVTARKRHRRHRRGEQAMVLSIGGPSYSVPQRRPRRPFRMFRD